MRADHDDEEFEDRRNVLRALRHCGIARGVNWIFVGLIIAFITLAVWMIATLPLSWLMGKLAESIRDPWPSIIVMMIYLICLVAAGFVGFLMMVIGKILCLNGPRDLGSPWSIIVAVIFEIFGLMLGAIAFFPALRGLIVFFLPLSMAGSMIFLEFLRTVAVYARRRRLAQLAVILMVATGMCLVFTLFGGVMLFTAGRTLEAMYRNYSVGMVLFLMGFFGTVVALIVYARLLFNWKSYLGV